MVIKEDKKKKRWGCLGCGCLTFLLFITLGGCVAFFGDDQEETTEKVVEEEHEDLDDTQNNSKSEKDGHKQQKLLQAKVIRIVDGDTIKVQLSDKEETVRLILVDTPETKHPSKPVQPFGKEASQFTKDMIEGQDIELEIGIQERDPFGRLLAYVYIEGKMLNKMLLANGLARVAVYPPNTTYVDEFKAVQSEARALGKGIWSIEDYVKEEGYDYEEKKQETVQDQAKQGSSQDSPKNKQLKFDPYGPDRDCGDFSQWDEAQAFFEARSEDPHKLDKDGDGIACDGLR